MLLRMLEDHPVFIDRKVVELQAGSKVEIEDEFIVNSLVEYGKAELAEMRFDPEAESVEEDTSETFDIETMTLEQLKQFAEANAIDLGDAKRVKSVRKVISEALAAQHHPAPVEGEPEGDILD